MMAKADIAALGLRAMYSFDQLVVGPNNHVAAAACLEVVKMPGEVYNPLFLYGPSGVGKTHLMQAVAQRLLETNAQAKIKYTSAERFISDVLTAVAEDRLLELRRSYSLLDLLIIDDVQYMTESKVSQEELFHIFNNLHQANRQVILAADRPPNQLTQLEKNIRSRLEWGLATDIRVPDEATRLEILRKKQSVQGLSLPEEMLLYAAHSLCSNVRELEGFLKRLHAYTTLSHQEITMALVESVVREVLPEGVTISPPETIAPMAPSPSKPMNGSTGTNGANGTHAPDRNHQNGHHRPAPAPGIPAFNDYVPGPPVRPPVEPPAPRAPIEPPTTPRPEPPRFDPEISSTPTPPASTVSFDLLLQSIDLASESAAPPTAPPAAKPNAPKAPPPPEPLPPRAPVAKAPPPPPPPPAPVEPVVSEPELVASDAGEEENGALPPGFKEVSAVFFYPEGRTDALENVHQKFQEVIKKHKLKFRLKRAHSAPYAFKGKINYSSFVDVCKANRVPVAIVIGPPPDAVLPAQDFYDLLTVTLDVQGVSLQLVNWTEIPKDYRYLNLALDIALVRSR